MFFTQKKLLPWVAGITFFMQWFDTGALNNLLPVLAAAFKRNPLHMHSLVTGFMLAMVLLMPVSGWMAERYGIRNVFMLAVSVFMAGSLICMAANGFAMFLAGKIIEGLGGAFLLPLSRLSVIRTYSREEMTVRLSFIAVPGLVGLFLGPVLAGFIAAWSSWRWVYLINIPVGFLILAGAWKFYPVLKARDAHRFDWLGYALIATAILSAISGIVGFLDWGWPGIAAWGAAAMSAVSLAAYCVYAKYAYFPIFNLKVFRISSFTIGTAGNLVNGLTAGAVPFMAALLLQTVFHLPASMAGIVLASGAFGSILAKNLVPYLLKVIGYRVFLSVNTCTLAVIIILFTLLEGHTPIYLMMAVMGLYSGFNSFLFTSTQTLALSDLGAEHASTGNTIVSVGSQFCSGFAAGLTTILLAFFAGGSLQTASAEIFRNVYFCVAAVNAVMLLPFLFAPRKEMG